MSRTNSNASGNPAALPPLPASPTPAFPSTPASSESTGGDGRAAERDARAASPLTALDVVFTGALSAGLAWLIAARRRQRKEMAAAVQAKTNVDQFKDEIVSRISHEWRTPLTSVVIGSKILQNDRLSTKGRREIAQKLLGASAQLERTIDLLVTHAALRGGTYSGHEAGLELASIVRSVVTEHAERNPGHDVVLRIGRDLPESVGDARLLTLALDQLVDNAVKFSPAGGTVAVDVRRAPGDAIELSVADHGIGIAEDKLRAIFAEFDQIDGSSTRSFGGLGLGLTFAQEAVQRHDGAIRVESKPGAGSTFTVTLPVRTSRPLALAG